MDTGIQRFPDERYPYPWFTVYLTDDEISVMENLIRKRIEKFKTEERIDETSRILERIFDYQVPEEKKPNEELKGNLTFMYNINDLMEHPENITRSNMAFNRAVALLLTAWLERIIHNLKEEESV